MYTVEPLLRWLKDLIYVGRLLLINLLGYNESKKLSPEAQKQRVLVLKKQNITHIIPSDVADNFG
jgi:hypothetical protein